MDYTVLYVQVHEHVKLTLFREVSTELTKSKQNKVIKRLLFALTCKSWTDLRIFFHITHIMVSEQNLKKDLLCRRNISYMYICISTNILINSTLKKKNQVDMYCIQTEKTIKTIVPSV